jgi:heme/copper-type cytochrome/quinol oxidase subunit 3
MNVIPYTVERRQDTGINNVQLGVWLFLASEAMLFAGLFSAYFTLRAGATEAWHPFSDHLGSASRGTLVLIAASAALAAAVRAARARTVMPIPGAVMAFQWGLFASVLFAFAFCAVKVSEYFSLFDQHLRPSTNTRMAVYFLLTGVHLLHVIGGILVNVWLMLTSSRTWREAPLLVVNRMEATALYWYFVDLVWLVIFVLLYVV